MNAWIDFPTSDGGRCRAVFQRPLLHLKASHCDDVVPVLRRAEAEARAGRWVVGYVAYEAAPAFDSALVTRPSLGNPPLAEFAVYAAAEPDALLPESGGFQCGRWRLDASAGRVAATVEALRQSIAEGRFYQVNFTGRLESPFAGDALALFRALRDSQPEGYCAFFDAPGRQILSVSPELFFDWEPGIALTTRPMKGTAARGESALADAAAREALRHSEKDRAENLMIVDLLRNDLSRLSEIGTVTVPRLFDIEPLPTAWQMTSTVQCRPRAEVTLPDVFRALFPCGSVTGAPKVAAMAAIADLETTPRGVYCGAVGLLRPGGHATFNVAIRTVEIPAGSMGARCGVGSGITYDSTPSAEYAEWLVKRRFLLRASADFELLETLRLEAGEVWLVDGHLARMGGSACHLGFPWDEAACRAALAAVALAHPRQTWRVRLLQDRQGRYRTEAFPLETTSGPLKVALAQSPVDETDEWLGHKTTERGLYAAHAPAPGIFDTLLWNRRGEITEFTRGNVVIELAGRRLTPPLSCGLLPGVLRQHLLARGEIAESVITREILHQARTIWLINSLRGEIPVQLV